MQSPGLSSSLEKTKKFKTSYLNETRVEKQTEEDKKKKKTSCNININKILEVFCSKPGVFLSKKTVIMFYSSSLGFLMTIRYVDSRDDTGIICHDLSRKFPKFLAP